MFAARQGFFSLAQARTAKTVQVHGSAAITLDQSRYGTASLKVGTSSTNNNYAYVAYNAPMISDLNNVSQWTDWCCEFWVRYDTIASIDDEGRASTIGAMEPTDWPLNWSFGATRNGNIIFSYMIGSTIYSVTSANSLVTTDTWYHMAAVKQGSTMTLYLNGVNRASGTLAGTISSAARPLVIGSYYRIGPDAWIDEVRISKTARYTGNFTVPGSAFSNDSNTLLLLHCEGAEGSTSIIDDNS